MYTIKKIKKYWLKFNDYYNDYAGGTRFCTLVDLCFARLIHGATISDYFQYRFWQKSNRCRSTFMTAKRNNVFYAKANPSRQARNDLNDKAIFNKRFEQYLGRAFLSAADSTNEQIRSFCLKEQVVFLKPCNLGAAEGVEKRNILNCADADAVVDTVKGKRYVLEGCIKQSAEMARLHPASINTIRMITYKKKNGVEIIGATLRIGQGGSFVDNHGAGGIMACIDIESGKVYSCGSSKRSLMIVRHPDTQVMIPGFQIPRWEEAKALVINLADQLPDIRHVGWDVVICEDGVKLIEANPSGDPVVLQEPIQMGVREVYESLLRE